MSSVRTWSERDKDAPNSSLDYSQVSEFDYQSFPHEKSTKDVYIKYYADLTQVPLLLQYEDDCSYARYSNH